MLIRVLTRRQSFDATARLALPPGRGLDGDYLIRPWRIKAANAMNKVTKDGCV